MGIFWSKARRTHRLGTICAFWGVTLKALLARVAVGAAVTTDVVVRASALPGVTDFGVLAGGEFPTLCTTSVLGCGILQKDTPEQQQDFAYHHHDDRDY